ncbi:hypothetical protein LCGC14_0337520 [marine sediment metagenome]|uniref:Uncharacterized protein n=1 Tax=marine sediment metagenome TaxID=412755 RepID=A0A0F9TEU0_9ZZZZ
MNKKFEEFEKFVIRYELQDKLFPKSTFIEDYAGGSREFFGTEVVEAYLKSITNTNLKKSDHETS